MRSWRARRKPTGKERGPDGAYERAPSVDFGRIPKGLQTSPGTPVYLLDSVRYRDPAYHTGSH